MAFGKGHHLHLIDGSAFIFRAYHALPPLTRTSDGLPVGAIAGFCNMLWKLLSEARDTLCLPAEAALAQNMISPGPDTAPPGCPRHPARRVRTRPRARRWHHRSDEKRGRIARKTGTDR